MTPAAAEHVPVMLDGVLRALAPRPGGRFVDATCGLGGHSEALLAAVVPSGRVVGIDRDREMLSRAEGRLAGAGEAFVAVRARLSYLADVVRGLELAPIDGVLLDLGICSAQLDDPERGLSFRHSDAPLDMRLDRGHGETVSELLERVERDELREILRAGGVDAAGRTAEALLRARPLRTVGDLREALQGVRAPQRRHHPATLVFQALRMAVNDETRELETALEAALEVLGPGGRLAVLSYHSGEDRRVKEFLAREVRGCICPKGMPRCGCGRSPRVAVIERGTAPDAAEVRRNPRARSARLRVGERL
jgi:16S rRNA (cytosine1402-N4)-methyltransferase